MQTEANKYGNGAPGTYNPQIGGSLKGQLQALAFNSSSFPPTAPPGYGTDDTPPDPCTADSSGRYIFDVKATENKVPLLLGGLLPSVTGPDLHATARVELRQILSLNPSMPLAVPDVHPRFVTITFVNTNTGNTLSGCSGGPAGSFIGGCTFNVPGPPAATAGINTWSVSNVTATIGSGNAGKIGIRIGLGASAAPCPTTSTGGAGYTCLDGYLPPPDPPDPPVTAVGVTPALASGTNTYSVSVSLEGNFKVYKPCSVPPATAGGGYSCPPNVDPANLAGDPTILLRFTTPTKTSSHTFAIDCGQIPGNPGQQNDLYQEIRFGCLNSFSVNDPDLCPDPANPSPADCAPIANVGNGNKTGPIQSAIEDRLVSGQTCAPNNYPDTTVSGDPRVVVLIVTDFSAFYGNGGGSVPVVTWGAFYITGWSRPNGNVATCNNEPVPSAAVQKGDVWGHFITYVASGPASTKPCVVGALAPCVPSLVK
jgi:hypothetical protein